jgi:alkaline phosphatase
MIRRGGASFSILSSFFTRDATCAALAAWAANRSMKRLSLASIACCRAYSAS